MSREDTAVGREESNPEQRFPLTPEPVQHWCKEVNRGGHAVYVYDRLVSGLGQYRQFFDIATSQWIPGVDFDDTLVISHENWSDKQVEVVASLDASVFTVSVNGDDHTTVAEDVPFGTAIDVAVETARDERWLRDAVYEVFA